MVLRAATSRDDIDVVAVNDPFIDAKYMVSCARLVSNVSAYLRVSFYSIKLLLCTGFALQGNYVVGSMTLVPLVITSIISLNSPV